MGLESAFTELQRSVSELLGAVMALGTTVDEDRPLNRDVVVAARLADDVLAARGFLEEALSAAGSACCTLEVSFDVWVARKSLATCHERLQRFDAIFHTDLACYERVNDLVRAALERGADWSTWVDVVRDELRQCRLSADSAHELTLACWQELVERAALGSISIRNVNVGQHFETAESQVLRSPES